MNFEKRCIFRLTEEQDMMLDKIHQKRQDIYQNKSHVLRCAIIKLYKEVVENGKI